MEATGPTAALSPGRRLVFSVLLAGLVLGACELVSRAYWVRVTGRSFRDRGLLLHDWYPELGRLPGDPSRHGDARYDVLVLGPSVLNRRYGVFDAVFDAALRARHADVSVVNLSIAGHTLRDALNKYRQLGDWRFDLVVVYDSINELRANNVPPELFRDDYSHVDWYWEVNPIAEHPRLAAAFTLPFGLRRAWLLAAESRHLREPVPRVHPDPHWLAFGGEIRSAVPLRAQLLEILEIARERGDPVLLSSFAWWLPPDYSLERFEARELDYAYGKKAVPVEVWGTPEHVALGLRRHNEVIAEVARNAPADYFADLAARMPPGRRYFQDVCHLAPDGIAVLVETWLAAVGTDRAAAASVAPN